MEHGCCCYSPSPSRSVAESLLATVDANEQESIQSYSAAVQTLNDLDTASLDPAMLAVLDTLRNHITKGLDAHKTSIEHRAHTNVREDVGTRGHAAIEKRVHDTNAASAAQAKDADDAAVAEQTQREKLSAHYKEKADAQIEADRQQIADLTRQLEANQKARADFDAAQKTAQLELESEREALENKFKERRRNKRLVRNKARWPAVKYGECRL